MSQDWIKMRTWLAKDPKVIAMADCLAIDRSFIRWLTFSLQQDCKHTALEHVEHRVIAAIVVAGLLQVWGTVRIDGRRPSEIDWERFVTNDVTCHSLVTAMSHDDLVITNATLYTLDEIAGVSGFGEAMANVGWVTEPSEEAPLLVFPKFFLQNHDATEYRRENDRIRQRRSRENRVTNAVTGHVTKRDLSQKMSPREEKRREEKREEDIKRGAAPLSADADLSLPILTPSENGHLGPTADELMVSWNAGPGVKCARISGKRKTMLTARNRDPFFRENWLKALERIGDCPFVCGDNARGWVADVDWFLRPDTVLKLIEGKYDSHEPAAVKGDWLKELRDEAEKAEKTT